MHRNHAAGLVTGSGDVLSRGACEALAQRPRQERVMLLRHIKLKVTLRVKT